MPQYQGIWTLQDAARLQSQQQWATDPLFENTTLLLQADNAPNAAQNNTFLDSSANAFTITRNGNTTQGTFTPFSATGWSNYANATNTGYLTLADNTAFNLSGGSYTIEGFINPDGLYTTSGNIVGFNTIVAKRVPNSSSSAWEVFLDISTGALSFYNGTIYASSTTPTKGVWSHFAAVYDGTNISLYLNGSRVLAPTAVANTNYSAGVYIGSYDAGSGNFEQFRGYISNIRVTKGAALYSGSTYTVPTAALTTTVSSGTVSLLTCQSNRFIDNSSNAFAITVNGNPSVQAFAPFAPQFQYTPTVIGGSGYFDGSGDFLTAANNAAFQLGTGDFTMECWYYPQDISLVAIFGLWGPTSSNASWLMYTDASGNPIWYTSTNGSTHTASLTSSRAITLNAWNHIVIERVSGTTTIYVNGASGGSTSTSVNLFAATSQLTIGYNPIGGTPDNVVGYLSGLRLVKGAYVYNGAFTPPTSPPTAVSGTSLLCNFTNAAITDGTMKNNLETVGNAQVSTSVVKYGSGSMAFDGTGDALTLPNSPVLQLGSADYTMEFWAYRSAATNMTWVFLNGNSSNFAGLRVDTDTSGNIFLLISTSGSAWAINTSGTAVLPTSTWTHIAVVRFGTSIRLYVNGISQISTTLSGAVTAGTSQQIGANFGATQVVNGYVDDLRLTLGIARYTANFTPPQVALPRQ
jgi:hypothetical protein